MTNRCGNDELLPLNYDKETTTRIRLFIAGLIQFMSLVVMAEVQISKDWVWDLSGAEYVYAATINEDGRILGQYCYFSDSSCIYLVSLGITCKAGSEYPSILNSTAGVVDVKLICGHEYQGENVFIIKPFDDVDNLVKQADNVGFAVAMEEGTFKVVRFSLSGSNHAIEMMRLGAEMLNERRSTNKEKVLSEEYL